MRYGTVCSGINAPAVAWNSLGWEEAFCAEIEAFPCSVLRERHPDVQNLGDITKYESWPDFGIDLLAGGTPCQSFSIAGLRKGMDDPRGQLTRAFIGIAARYRPRILVWENVPGVFSADDGQAFAGLLAGLSGRKVEVPKDGFGTFGIVPGIPDAYGLAWRVLDTQFVRVDTHPRACPQRRERVFVVGYLGGCWQRAAAVLLERESLQGNPEPRRTKGQSTSASIAPSLTGSSRGVPRPGDSRGQDPVVAVATTIGCRGNRSHSELDGHGAHIVSHVAPEIARCDATREGGSQDYETTTMIACEAVGPTMGSSGPPYSRTGNERQETEALIAFDTTQITSMENRSNPKQGDPCHPLAEGAHPPAIAFMSARAIRNSDTSNGIGINGDDVGFALRANASHSGDKGDGGMNASVVATSLQGAGKTSQNSQGSNLKEEVSFTLNCLDNHGVHHGRAVRRLTPKECARLQGFPDDYLNVMHNGKLAKDGPKYRALGNAMSVNVMRWLGQRIAMVDTI